ncbi:MAG: nucleotide exchange factor GrpE [Clostridia bacterium]|nr:nucleotide exchange factor GrpE [Clostridia bacterium]
MEEQQTKKPTVKALLAENEQLKKEIETLKAEGASTKESWLRCAADFENFKKRNQDTRINAYKEGKIDIIKKILVVGDTLDRALTMNLDEKTMEGIKLIARQFSEMLEAEGVTEINPVGEPFDPNFHEAIMQMPKAEGETSGNVKQVFLKGYKLNDKVIRYAQVVVIGD